MARVAFTNEKEATGKELEAYLELKNQGKLTNMKEALLQDYATYDAFRSGYIYGITTNPSFARISVAFIVS